MNDGRIAYPRHGAWVVACVCALFVLVPAAAHADSDATPPVLVSPAAGASVQVGTAQEYTWTGSLLGDSQAIGRSYMEVQIAPSEGLPEGQNATWTPTRFFQTVPGDANTHSLALGSPSSAGSYVWRVCGYGIVDTSGDAMAEGAISQVACSPARAVTVTAAPTNDVGAVGVIDMQHTTSAPTQTTPVTKTIVKTLPRPKAPVKAPPAKQPVATFVATQALTPTSIAKQHADGTPVSDLTGQGGAVSGVSSALSWSIPGLPIPFWTLLLLAAAYPVAIWWRRMFAAMFELQSRVGR